MDGDHPISHAQAIELQLEAQQAGSLMMWTITHDTADYGELWVARPQTIGTAPKGRWGTPIGWQQHASQRQQPIPFPFVLLATELETLRGILPPGLTRITRQPDDDPVIVEVWL